MSAFDDLVHDALFGDAGAFKLPSWVRELGRVASARAGDIWDEYLYLLERGKTEPNARRILMAKYGAAASFSSTTTRVSRHETNSS